MAAAVRKEGDQSQVWARTGGRWCGAALAEEGFTDCCFLKGWTFLPQNYQDILRKELFGEGVLMVSLPSGSGASRMRV